MHTLDIFEWKPVGDWRSLPRQAEPVPVPVGCFTFARGEPARHREMGR
jgi:hypothetical protein